MVEIKALLLIIKLLFAGLVSVTIITFALVIVLVAIKPIKKHICENFDEFDVFLHI